MSTLKGLISESAGHYMDADIVEGFKTLSHLSQVKFPGVPFIMLPFR